MRVPLPIRRTRSSQTFSLEAMEPRVLFSADAAVLLGGLALDGLHDDLDNVALIQSAPGSASSNDQNTAAAESNAVELIVIDNSVDDADWIAEQLRAENKSNRVIVFLDTDKSGIEQISGTLEQYDNVSALHIFSHGEDAELLLGNERVGITELMINAQQISGWAASLTDGADILLYGCDLTSSENGVEFATLLGQLTQADIAASNNLTSGYGGQGDWTLEHRTGSVEADTQLAGRMLNDYEGELATFTVTSLADTNEEGTLRWAIQQANNAGSTTEPHVLDFSVAGTITLTNALPVIQQKIDIDATTAPGYSVDSGPVVIVDGNATFGSSGFQLRDGSDGSFIRGLDIRNFTSDNNTNPVAGIQIQGSEEITVLANHIGTNGANLRAILIDTASNNTIGDGTETGRNVLSGNTVEGIKVAGNNSQNNLIIGNYIGVDATGQSDLANGVSGVRFQSAGSNNTVGGTGSGDGNVISGNVVNNVHITGTDSVTVQGNLIGLGADGLTDIDTSGEDTFQRGLFVENSSTNTLIGGPSAAAGNVISGSNSDGVRLSGSTNTTIQNNYIGTDEAGTLAVGNGRHGIFISNSASEIDIIENVVADSGVVSVIGGHGISITGQADNVTMQGNLIGLGIDGTAMGNTTNGIAIIDNGLNDNSDLYDITVGGVTADESNIIANNGNDGIAVSSSYARILGNQIFANSELGIDLADDGAIEPVDTDVSGIAPEDRQNFPQLLSADSSGGNTIITGTLSSEATKTYRVEFFATPSGDGSNFGEGKYYLGAASVTTDSSGEALISEVLSGTVVPDGYAVTATATQDNDDGTYNYTSEFGPNVTATNDTPGIFADAIITDVIEDGGTIGVDVQLTTKPTADVTIEIASSDTSEGTVDQAKSSVYC